MLRADDIGLRAMASPVRFMDTARAWRTRAMAAQMSWPGEMAVALACATAAVVVRYLLDSWLGPEHVYAVAIGFTAVAALTAGWRAGLGCAVLAQVASNYLFLSPRGTFTSLMFDPEGATFYLMTAILLCVTEMAVRAQRSLRVLLKRLGQADAAKSELLALIAHELRNPVSAIGLALQRLEVADANPQARERAMGVIHRQLPHIARLTDDLTDASRIQTGKVSLNLAEHRMVDLVSTARDLVEVSLEQRKQRIELHVDEALTVCADDARIVQVLANVLHNASKYSPDGTTITVDSHMEGACACIKVTDQGFGIPNEQLEWVFDTYAQLKPGGDGLGLGLSLVRKLVHLHGGTIKALSRGAGEGSTFEICLPLTPAGSQEARSSLPRRSAR